MKKRFTNGFTFHVICIAVVFAAGALLGKCSFAGDLIGDTNWYQVSANATLVIDYLQTRQAIGSGRFEETNPILGKQPSNKDIDVYFASALIITNLVGSLLPDEMSDMFYLTIAVVEGKQVFDNYQVGVRIQF